MKIIKNDNLDFYPIHPSQSHAAVPEDTPRPLLTGHLLLTQLSPGQVRDVISGMPVLGLHWCLRFGLGISD